MPTRNNTTVPSRLEFGSDAPVQLQAAGGEGEKLRTFSTVAYTGGRMIPCGFTREIVLDLSGVTVEAGSRPVLKDHKEPIGHTTDIQIGNQIVASGVISGANAATDEVVRSSDKGFPWRASVGGIIHRIVSVAPGRNVVVNGRTFTGPLLIAQLATLREISFLPLAADGETSVLIAAGDASNTLEIVPMELEKWLEAKGFTPDDLTDDQRTTLQAAFDAEHSAPPDDDPPAGDKGKLQASAGDDPTAATLKAMRKTAAAELRRQTAIRDLCATGHTDIAAKAIEENWSVEKAELAILRASRPEGPANHTGGGNGGPDRRDVLEASLVIRCGIAEEDQLGKWYSERVLNAAMGRENRSTGIHALMHETCQAAGRPLRGGVPIGNEEIRHAFACDRQLMASGYSTVSLAGILGATANKSLLASFLAVDAVSLRVAGIADVNNFHTHTRYRMTGTGDVEKVGPSGELPHGEFSEDSYTIKAETYGKIVGLNRQQIINDDLGAFNQVPRMLGRKCAIALESAFWTMVLANSGNHFHANNSNYSSGAATALQISALTTAEQMFLDQTDADGDPILVTPAVLLVPSGLKVAAHQLMTETRVNETTTANKPKPGNNPHAGKWRTESTPYLNNSAMTGYSTTAWYLLANPADIPVWEIAFLRGQRSPTIESADSDFHQLGIQYRAYWDFGVDEADHRGGVKMAGA